MFNMFKRPIIRVVAKTDDDYARGFKEGFNAAMHEGVIEKLCMMARSIKPVNNTEIITPIELESS